MSDAWEASLWASADRLAALRGMGPPSARRRLVERVAWGMHAAHGLDSPREAWAAMGDVERVELYLSAAGAIEVYDSALIRLGQAEVAEALAARDEAIGR